MAFDSVLLKYFKEYLFRYKYLSFLYIFKEVESCMKRPFLSLSEGVGFANECRCERMSVLKQLFALSTMFMYINNI